jgi:hypothetical protein
MQDAFAERVMDARVPAGAALFGRVREDGGVGLYFTPLAGQIAKALLKPTGHLRVSRRSTTGQIDLSRDDFRTPEARKG